MINEKNKYINITLTRNLRKSLLQGQPWIYSQNIKVNAKKTTSNSTVCKILDQKGLFVGWGIFCPNNPIAVRMLSFEKNTPDFALYESRLNRALSLRTPLRNSSTSAYRIINGEGDRLPGLVCDLYNDIAVLQFDGEDCFNFWNQDWLANWLLKNNTCKTVYLKPRHDQSISAKTWGLEIDPKKVTIVENGVNFLIDLVNGQKTGFFLDQRDNREYIKSISKNKTILNLFSYSGGFSIYAGTGGAKKVTSVDIAQGALELATQSWNANNLDPSLHSTKCEDVFEFLKNTRDKFDIVICDPPSLAKSEKVKSNAVEKYIETFSAAAKLVKPEGHLVLSSCSSHISFVDFDEIVNATLSKCKSRGQIIRISGQGIDHPFPHAFPQLRYLKFYDIVIE